MHNFAPGDIALTRALPHQKSKWARQNSGKQVELVEFIGEHTWPDCTSSARVWRVRWLDQKAAVDCDGTEWTGLVLISEQNLMRLEPKGREVAP